MSGPDPTRISPADYTNPDVRRLAKQIGRAFEQYRSIKVKGLSGGDFLSFAQHAESGLAGPALAQLGAGEHDSAVLPGDQDENLGALAREIGELSFETGTRRTFVKAAVSLLDNQRREGERVLAGEEIHRLSGSGSADAPERMPDEVEF